ncbi:MAG: tetratricopeptide repeat protein [Chloroflexota bacterium]
MTHLKFVFFLVISVFSFASAAAQSQQQACETGVNYGSRGNNLISRQDYEGAIQALNCAIQLDSQNAAWYLLRGVAYFYTHDYDQALVDITQSDTLAPKTPITEFYLAAVYDARGDHQSAIDYLNKAIDKRSDYLDAIAYRGVEYLQQGDYETAILDFDRALEIKSDFAYAYFYRASAYANLRHYDNAIADFDHAFELEPTYKDTYILLGMIRAKASDYGRFVSRVRTLNLAIQYNPFNLDLYRQRGTAHSAINDADEAIADFTQVLERNPDDARAYYARGSAYFLSQKHDDAALADFDRATELDPNLFYVYTTRSTLYMKLKDYPHAIADYTHIIELSPQIPKAFYTSAAAFYDNIYLYRGYAYSLNGDHTEAGADLLRYASRDGTQIVDAGELTVGQFITIEMSEGQVFQFKFDGVAGQHFKLSAVSARRYITVDTVMIILDPDGKPVDGNGNNSDTDLAAIIKDFEVPEAGRYTLIVTHANSFQNGSVKVLIEDIPPRTS